MHDYEFSDTALNQIRYKINKIRCYMNLKRFHNSLTFNFRNVFVFNWKQIYFTLKGNYLRNLLLFTYMYNYLLKTYYKKKYKATNWNFIDSSSLISIIYEYVYEKP